MTAMNFAAGSRMNSGGRYLCRGQFTVDLFNHDTFVSGRNIPLPPCTFEYLVSLMRHAPNAVSYKALVADAQGMHLKQVEAQDLARLKVYMLRKVLEENDQTPRLITSVPGFGYRLEF